MAQQYKSMVTMFVVGFVFGFLIAWGMFSQNTDVKYDQEQDHTATDQQTTEETENVIEKVTQPKLVAENNVVHVKDQRAGAEVFLSRVELTQDGWAAVREVENGTPTNILGAKRFNVGVHQSTVTLLRDTIAGTMYQVVLYADDGDKEFDFTTDALLTDRSGNPIAMSFEAY